MVWRLANQNTNEILGNACQVLEKDAQVIALSIRGYNLDVQLGAFAYFVLEIRRTMDSRRPSRYSSTKTPTTNLP
jgi:hypothetical protein